MMIKKSPNLGARKETYTMKYEVIGLKIERGIGP